MPFVRYLILVQDIVMVCCYTFILVRFAPLLFELFKNRRAGNFSVSLTPSFVVYIGAWFVTAFFGFTGNTYLTISWRPISINTSFGLFWSSIPEKCLSYGTVLVALFVNLDRILILSTKHVWRTSNKNTIFATMIGCLVLCWIGFGTFYSLNFVANPYCRVFACIVTKFAIDMEGYYKIGAGVLYVVTSVIVLAILKHRNATRLRFSTSKSKVGEFLTLVTVGSQLTFDILPYLVLWFEKEFGDDVLRMYIGSYPRMSASVSGALCAWIYHRKLLPLLRAQRTSNSSTSQTSCDVRKMITRVATVTPLPQK